MGGYTQAQRLQALPPYVFAELDRMKQEQLKKGVDIISLGIGDPDLPTPPHIIQALAMTAADPRNHQYPSYEGLLTFRKAAADWYRSRFGVTLDPANEVLTLIGSKEGIGHLPLAFIDPGDVVLVPDPAYPVYQSGTLFAGGVTYPLPLTRERSFLPDLDAIPADVLKRAKILWLNYPNNPTGAIAPRSARMARPRTDQVRPNAPTTKNARRALPEVALSILAAGFITVPSTSLGAAITRRLVARGGPA